MSYVIEGMDTDIKTPHHNKDLNPKEQVCCEELVNGLVHFLKIMATTRDLYKVFCPEPACISQSISNMFFFIGLDISNLTENSIIIQATDILL